MTWTRAQYMDRTRALMDARSSQDWLDDDIRAGLGMVHSREWKRLLDANQYLRVAERAVTQDASGQVALSLLDSGSADSQQRLYRILYVTNGLRVYDEDQRKRLPLATVTGVLDIRPCWYRNGDVIQLLPIESGASLTIVTNHTPTPIDQLSDDAVAVEFPRDYELLPCYEAAAWLLAKGGRETGATGDLLKLADMIRAEMLGDLARTSTDPTQVSYPDLRSDWGAEGWGS